eukprot:664244-Rhodomonas_salina.1
MARELIMAWLSGLCHCQPEALRPVGSVPGPYRECLELETCACLTVTWQWPAALALDSAPRPPSLSLSPPHPPGSGSHARSSPETRGDAGCHVRAAGCDH